jgi:putative membrane protein
MKESSMQAEFRILHVIAFLALGGVALAQMGGAGGQSTGIGQGSYGQSRPGTAQPGTGGNPDEPSSMSSNMKSPDEEFMRKAAAGGLAEVELGNLAKQNGGSEAVKQFGDRMVNDHSKANSELQQLAQQKGIALPSKPESKDRRLAKTLESKQGADFDKAYARDMVKDHEADIAEFRKEAESGKDPAVKAWAQQTLPVLQQHLEAAKLVEEKVLPGAMSSPQQ